MRGKKRKEIGNSGLCHRVIACKFFNGKVVNQGSKAPCHSTFGSTYLPLPWKEHLGFGIWCTFGLLPQT